MNKQIFTCLILCLAWCVSANAKVVTRQQALQKAQQFMVGKQFSEPAQRRGQMLSSPSEAYYVFNAERNGGFVIVAGDDRMPEILGYSDHGKLEVEAAPCGLKWLLGAYEQMAKGMEREDFQPASHRTRAANDPIAPFISTTWGQSTPYNAMCPKADGARCMTGCVATAMAQIMNYYCWPNETSVPIPAYTTETNKISMPQLEPTTFTWGHQNKNQLSKLMLYCGQSVQMDYGPEESGAGVPLDALKNYFGYDEGLNLIMRDEFSEDQWNGKLYEELSSQRPVYYFGYDGQSGHAFILSGYKDARYYINWGWDGNADGYYVLDGLSPAVGSYNLGQGAVIGVKPNGEPTTITYYPRKVVMENRAWSLDGMYVIGLETADRLAEEYPENFIGIQMHVSDPMRGAENYEAIVEKTSCNPHCLINRATSEFSPTYPDIKSLVEAQKDIAIAKVNASAVYAKPDKSAIKVMAESTFGFDGIDEDFRLAFVLLEDQVGPYTQSNGIYSNPNAADDPDDWMNEWVHKGDQVEMLFDDVARGIYGSPWGIGGSIPSIVQRGEQYHYEYTFNVPLPEDSERTGWEVNPFNSENFRVVTLLIDNSTGEIINACQTKITYDPSVESQTFDFRNKDKRLVSDEIVNWYSKGVEDNGLVLGTNLKANGLRLSTFDGKKTSGTAVLEIMTNTLGSPTLSWGMSGEDVILTSNSKTISFTTNERGEAEIRLKASNISQFGILEAKLTATINGASQSVTIKFVHQQSGIQIGDDIELENGQNWWLNGSLESSGENVEGLMFGTMKEERYYLATYIPADLFGDKTPTIDGIAFYGSTVGMGNVKVWISTHLPSIGEEPDIASYSYQGEKVIINRFNEMVFNQHYRMPEDGVYVGYSFDIVDMNAHRSGSPIMFSNKTREGALWWMTDSKPEWKDHEDYIEGNLAIKILFGGNVVKKNAAVLTKVQPLFSMVNEDTELFFEIHNEGSEPISTFDIKIDGKRYPVELYGWSMNPSSYQAFGINVNTGSVAKYQQKTLVLSNVNGKPNECEDNSMKGDWFISRRQSPTVAVMEEFTATWCGFSLLANKALDIYKKQFGDKLILIQAHGSSIYVKDPMEIDEYSEIRKLNTGMYPSCLINRTRGTLLYDFDDPMAPFIDGEGEGFFNLDKNIDRVLGRIMPVAIEVGAEWSNDTRSAINILTRTRFELDAEQLPLQIGYVLLEDGLTGEGEEWAQHNDFAGLETTQYPQEQEFASLPSVLYNQKYDNVPVAAWDAYKGVEGSLVGPFKAGVPIEGSFLADISSNTLIQDKENLSVVALIVNKETGKIINAAKCKIGDTLSPLTITSVHADNRQFDVYDMQGRKVRHTATSLNGLPRGIYIINGRKVVK